MATLAPDKALAPTLEEDIQELRRLFQDDGWVPAREYFRDVNARHGDVPELSYYKSIFLPAKAVMRPSTKPYRSHRADFDWIKAHAGEYYGQWLALDQGVLLAHGSDAGEVSATARATAPDADFILFHAVGFPR